MQIATTPCRVEVCKRGIPAHCSGCVHRPAGYGPPFARIVEVLLGRVAELHRGSKEGLIPRAQLIIGTPARAKCGLSRVEKRFDRSKIPVSATEWRPFVVVGLRTANDHAGVMR